MARHDAEGLLVELSAIPHLTAPGLLTGAGLRFQCPPLDELGATYAHSHTDYETITTQHSIKGVPQLATVQFQTLVVDWGTYVVDINADPDDIKARIKKICLSGTPVWLSCSYDMSPSNDIVLLDSIQHEIDWAATLRSVKITEKAGEPDARYLDVTFTEYRDPRAHRRGKGRPGGRHGATHISLYWDGHATDQNGRPLRVPVTFSSLARHFYKDPSLARVVATANHLGNWALSEPLINAPRFKKLRKGQFDKITIPSKPSSDGDLVAVLGPVVEAVP